MTKEETLKIQIGDIIWRVNFEELDIEECFVTDKRKGCKDILIGFENGLTGACGNLVPAKDFFISEKEATDYAIQKMSNRIKELSNDESNK